MNKKLSLLLLVAMALQAAPTCGGKEPSQEQVQTGVFSVISNWANRVLGDGSSDDFDIAASSVARAWATGEYMKGAARVVLKQVTAKAAEEAVNTLFPASWAVELVRGQIIGWMVERGVDSLAGGAEFRSDRRRLSVSQIRAMRIPFVTGLRADLSANLPDDLVFTDHFLVGYSREKRHVSLLVTSDYAAESNLVPGRRPRAWQANYEIDDNGLPKNPRQSLQRMDMVGIAEPLRVPTAAPLSRPTATPPTKPTIPTATLTPTAVPIPRSTPTQTRGPTPTPLTPKAPPSGWTRQFSFGRRDSRTAVAVDNAGNAYVSGDTGVLAYPSAVFFDVFVRKYHPEGREVWTRQFGDPTWVDSAQGVAVDNAGNVYVTGSTVGTFPGQSSAGGADAFVRKYHPEGREVWTRQFGTGGTDAPWGVAVDNAGSIYVAGYTEGTLPGQASAGSDDAFVRKYDPEGRELWTRQFGSATADSAQGVAVDQARNVYVAGTIAGTLPGQASAGGAFVRKYDPEGRELWTRQFGSATADSAQAVAVDQARNVYVAGTTAGTLPGQASAGGTDVFLRKYDPEGRELWTRQFGSPGSNSAGGVAVDNAGNVYVAGTTFGILPGQASAGNWDAFVRAYDPEGRELWTGQFGSPGYDFAEGVAVDNVGNVYVAGTTDGTLPGQASAGDADVIVIKIG